MNNGKIRVVVVDDSLTVRKRIREVLESAPDMEVVGEAGDGREAIEVCRELRPQAITLDMMLPVMSGLAATEYIMAHFPTPILIVSSSTNRGELFKTYEALAAGALDILEKPASEEPEGDWPERLVSAVRLISRVKVITHLRGKLPVWQATRETPPSNGASIQVVAIGASTGGPAAVVELLRKVPSDFAAPILLVLHLSAPLAGAFAEWLDAQTEHRVAWATQGAAVATLKGVVMAPPERHIVVRHGVLYLTHDAERNSCRPSIDVLFESIARDYGKRGAACLLTGMGRDGAKGLLQIRQAGGMTFAQDEATSVVYGMPAEAARLGAAERILPLDAIGNALAALGGPRP
jgi:two-component system, chemotaxis family, protein-glutamate methylesterase/glutaminase